MIGVSEYADYFAKWVEWLLQFWNFMITPRFWEQVQLIGDQVRDKFQDSLDFGSGFVSEVAFDQLAMFFLHWFGNASLLEIILGSALWIFVIYTLVKWILDIIF